MASHDPEREKELAALAAVDLVTDGMVVGLGSGSTAAYAIRRLGALVAEGLQILGIPTSIKSRELALACGIRLSSLSDEPEIDLTIDGADRFDKNLNLIKGGGGALLREKIVAASTQRVVIVVDSRKKSDPLGGFPLPIEVIKFGLKPLMQYFEASGLCPSLRRSSIRNEPFVTDEDNYIIDLSLDLIGDPDSMRARVRRPGVVEHGLFIDMVSDVFMGVGEKVVHFTAEDRAHPNNPDR